MLENDKKIENKKVDTNVSNAPKTEEKSIFDLLDIEEAENEKAFLSHTIIAKVNGYRITNDSQDRAIKVQIQNKSTDEETGALVDFTFTLSAEPGIIKESEIKDLIGKKIKVSDIIRYADVNKNSMGQEISRTHRYGGEYANMIVVPNTPVENNEVNTYVDEIILTSVSNVMKKGIPTGDVNLISIKNDTDGSVKTFEIKLKHDEIGRKLNKDMFKPILNKKIRVNFINDNRINGKTFYNTLVMPTLA